MKQKTPWIIAALIFCFGYIAITIFPATQYNANIRFHWLLDAGVMLVFTVLVYFPITAIIALFYPKGWNYEERFSKILPFLVIFLGAFFIFAVLANAW